MITILSGLFIKNRDQFGNSDVRRAYGMLCSIVGIALNVFLFAGKYLAGVISGSIAITADAFNNLSDAGSSLISLVGFKFSGMKADADHPFGHGVLSRQADARPYPDADRSGGQVHLLSLHELQHG